MLIIGIVLIAGSAILTQQNCFYGFEKSCVYKFVWSARNPVLLNSITISGPLLALMGIVTLMVGKFKNRKQLST